MYSVVPTVGALILVSVPGDHVAFANFEATLSLFTKVGVWSLVGKIIISSLHTSVWF